MPEPELDINSQRILAKEISSEMHRLADLVKGHGDIEAYNLCWLISGKFTHYTQVQEMLLSEAKPFKGFDSI